MEIKNLYELNEKHKKLWKSYLERENNINNEIQKIKNEAEKKINVLNKKNKNLKFHGGLRELFNNLAVEIQKKLNSSCFEWYGPFGLNNEQTIYFYKDKNKKKILGSICFVSFRDGYAIRDEKKNNGLYQKGTIGEMNGGNHPIIEITEKINLDWLVKWAKRNK